MLDATNISANDINNADRAAVQVPRLRAGTKKPVLIVLHQESSNPGHVGQWLARNGFPIDIRKPRFGDPLPATLAGHCGAVIFGGPMSANDKDEFIRREIEWISVALKEQAPLLGICLGAQMLAMHLGAKVGFDPQERAEIGYYPLRPTPAGLALDQRLGPMPDHVYQWHREGCELPSGARHLATSDGPFPNQAFAYGPAAVGVQFHPEITCAQVHRWTGHHLTRLDIKGARQRHEHIAGHIAHAPKVQAWLGRFLERWVLAELPIG
ncbi:MAG TPA: glutamine amidotransferase [Hyphomicrobiaceae bacterium]|nr:glutamine amidotransferase [Hyphomicrobiaceae bacterium]